MNKLFTYVPILFLIIVMYFLNNSLVKSLLLAVCIGLIIVAKYKRSKLQKEEIEYDDRVNANISKWSLRSMVLMNTLLILILFMNSQGILKLQLDMEMILLYLLLTLSITFYIVPTIIKRY